MIRHLLALACAALTLLGQGQPVRDRTLGPILTFETQRAAGPLGDWGGGPSGTLFADNQVVHSGLWSARIERTASHTGQPIERIEADSDRDRWFTAAEAKSYGFIDQVIERAADVTEPTPAPA